MDKIINTIRKWYMVTPSTDVLEGNRVVAVDTLPCLSVDFISPRNRYRWRCSIQRSVFVDMLE